MKANWTSVISYLQSEKYKAAEIAADFPWDECMDKMKEEGIDCPECACAAIKNRTVKHAMETGLAKDETAAIELIISEFKNKNSIAAYLAGKIKNEFPQSTAVININGVIGTYKDDKGIEQKGVELIDVISQYEKNKNAGIVKVKINSPGGLVEVGYAIHDYLKSLKKEGKHIITEINGMCASIATAPYLAGDERLIVRGSKFLIHNPYLTNIEGDADALRQYAVTLDSVENGLAKFYSKITGVSTSAIDLLMKENKEITAEKALELGFATKIIDGNLQQTKNFHPIASFKTKTTEMNTLVKKGKEALEELKRILSRAKSGVRNLDVETQDGKTLVIDGELAAGSVVTLDGEPTPNATYTLADGSTLKTDENSVIVSVTAPEASAADIYEHAKMGDLVHDTVGNVMKSKEFKTKEGKTLRTDENGRVVAITAPAATLLTPDQIITLQKDNSDMKVTIANFEKLQKETEVVVAELKKNITSGFVPNQRKPIFNRERRNSNPDDMASEIRAAREERNKQAQNK